MDTLLAPRPAPRLPLLVALLLGSAALCMAAAMWHHGAVLQFPGADSLHRARGLVWVRRWAFSEAVLFAGLAALVALAPGRLRRLGGLSMLDRRAGLVLAACVAVHVTALLFDFPLREIASADPATTCDHAYHYYQVYAAHRLLQSSGHLWGYDPFFMAGYPAGVIFDLDMKGAELFCHALAGIGLARAFKAYILLALFLYPLAAYAAARWLGLRRRESLAAVGLGLLFWHWGRPLLGHFRWAGMHSYVLASYLSVVALALFCRTVRAEIEPAGSDLRRRVLRGLGLVGLVAVACQVHPLAVLHLAPGFLAVYGLALRRLRPAQHAAFLVGFALVLLANADWLVPFLRFRHYKTASNFWFQLRGFHDLLFFYTRETSILFTAITVLGIVGLVQLRRRDGLAVLGWAASAGFLFLAAFYGARLRMIANTEPGRYLVPFTFLLCVPAGIALAAGLERIERRVGSAAILAAGVGALSLVPLLSLAENLFFDAHAIEAHVDPRFLALVEDLRDRTSPDARLLFETPGGFANSSDLFYGGHLQALVPLYTGRETIGGPYPVNFLVHAGIDFKNGELCGRMLRDWQAADLDRFMDTYNVGWAVCWSAAARASFDRRPEMARRVADFDPFRVYEILRPRSFLLRGAGVVRADYNRIEVKDAQGPELVLSYHWLESLRCDPPLPIDAVAIPGDPVGFIRVRPEGVTHFVISNSY